METSFKQKRERLGLKQSELAAKLGLNQSTISRLETGTMEVDERTSLALDALLLRSEMAEGQARAA